MVSPRVAVCCHYRWYRAYRIRERSKTYLRGNSCLQETYNEGKCNRPRKCHTPLLPFHWQGEHFEFRRYLPTQPCYNRPYETWCSGRPTQGSPLPTLSFPGIGDAAQWCKGRIHHSHRQLLTIGASIWPERLGLRTICWQGTSSPQTNPRYSWAYLSPRIR